MPPRADLFLLELPLRVPWTTAMGSLSSRTVALVRIGEDVVGWGEAAPYPGLDPALDLDDLQRGGLPPTVAAAIDQAFSDRTARLHGRALTTSATARIPIQVAVGLDDPLAGVNREVERGVSRFKLKVAPGAVRHVLEVREAHPDVVIGVDANRSFASVDELLALGDADVAYIEEPFESWGSAAEALAESTGIPLLSDESLRSASDVGVLLAIDSISGITIKPGRLGWTQSLEARKAAIAVGKQWRASGLLETEIGRAFADRLASLPGGFLSDVAPTEAYFVDDVAPSRSDGADVLVPSGVGLGVVPDPEKLARYTVAQTTIDVT